MAGEQLVGSVLAGRYRVVQLLGTGGTADVYVGQCLSPGPSLAAGEVRAGEHVALKVLRAAHEHDRGAVARFQREALAAARAACSGVVAVHEVAFEHRPMFFATELLVGLDLADTLAAARRLDPSRAVRIARAALDALAVAHGRGVLHRDVKPENIFLVHAPDGREIVKLIDFGLAWDQTEADEDAPSPRRITARAHVVGTPEYMAPEQLVGERPTPSWDLYALGVVVFEMLAGVLPFRGDDYADIARQHLSAAPPLLSSVRPAVGISPALEAWVDKALRKDPRFRHASAGEMAAALAAVPEARGGRPREP